MTMKIFAALTAAAMIAAAGAAPARGIPANAPKAEDYGARDRISSVSVAPDGKHVAALIALDGKTRQVAVWSVENLSAPPFIIPSATGIDIQRLRFVKNDRLFLTLVQTIETEGGRSHAYRSVITDLTGSFFQTLSIDKPGADKDKAGVMVEINDTPTGSSGLTFEGALPNDPDSILAGDGNTGDLYKVNLHAANGNFIYERVYNGSDKYSGEVWDFDDKTVRARQTLDYKDGHPYIAQFFRNPDTGAWEEHFRFYAKDREDAEVMGFAKDPNIAYVKLNNGQDKTAFYEYSIRERKLSAPLFAHPAFDVANLIRSRDSKDFGAILGYQYDGPTGDEVYWDDDRMAGLQAGFKKVLGEIDASQVWTDPASGQKLKLEGVPQNFSVAMRGMSLDRKTIIVERSGPKTPPEYFLYVEGKPLTLLGRSRPQIKPDALGDTRLIQYTARDGLVLAAYLTKPNPAIWGPGPYPAIVVPHGGPWARDYWEWDPTGWDQYFAARGYVVIKPQYRTSTDWGRKIAHAGDNQYGLKMSDDNDDAALWLESQGLARKGHVAIHGYSYGGFAAFAAGVRGANGVFRCAIAGAGVADLNKWKTYAGENKFEREYLADTMTGMSPWDHAAETPIPMLIYHGDRDQRVPIREGQGMYDKLKAAGKQVKLLILKDQGHQLNLWTPEDVKLSLETIEDYLAHDCGPGGINGGLTPEVVIDGVDKAKK